MSLRKRGARMLALTMAAILSLSMLPIAVYAGASGRRNTAIGLGAAAIYLLAKGKTGSGLAAAAGSAYAYKRYRDTRRGGRHNSYYRRSHYARSNRHHGRYACGSRNRYCGTRSYRRARHDNGRHRGWHQGTREAYGRTRYAHSYRRA